MSIDQLLIEITEHYRERGFPELAINHLKATIRRKLKEDSETIVFQGEYVLDKKIDDLLEHFHLTSYAAVSESKSTDADAIFAFSFGYRTRRHCSGGAESRLPGPNNRALAEIAVEVKASLEKPLFAQFEIADAIDDYTNGSADYATPREDMNTDKAIKYFLGHQKVKYGHALRKVVVVAHKHHIGRCLILLSEDFEILAHPFGRQYDGYDHHHEAQARVTSVQECIVSDFVSMAARAKPKPRSGA